MNYFRIFIIVIIVIVIFLALSMYDESHTYDLKLNFKKDDNGNYYFYTNVYIWQRNKLKQLKSTYRQGTIIKRDYDNSNFSVKISIPLENTGVSSVFAASVWPFSLIFSLARRNEGNFFQAVPTTLSRSLAEVRLASLVAWA